MRKILSIWFFVLSFILLFATNFNFTVFMICYFLITAVAHFCLSCNPEDIMGTPPMVRSSWFGLYTLASIVSFIGFSILLILHMGLIGILYVAVWCAVSFFCRSLLISISGIVSFITCILAGE